MAIVEMFRSKSLVYDVTKLCSVALSVFLLTVWLCGETSLNEDSVTTREQRSGNSSLHTFEHRVEEQLAILSEQIAALYDEVDLNTQLSSKHLELSRQMVKLLAQTRSTPSSKTSASRNPVDVSQPRDCEEVRKAGFRNSGKYTIYPDGGGPFKVFCEMGYLERRSGSGVHVGWTIFQRRVDGSINFYRNWTEYRDGFGNVLWEHWLGNEKIHRLTSQKRYSLQIDVKTPSYSINKFANYEIFQLAAEREYYKVTVEKGYYDTTSPSADVMRSCNGSSFSTYDADNDGFSSTNCAAKFRGAWWYKGTRYGCGDGTGLNIPYITERSSNRMVIPVRSQYPKNDLYKTTMKICPAYN